MTMSLKDRKWNCWDDQRSRVIPDVLEFDPNKRTYTTYDKERFEKGGPMVKHVHGTHRMYVSNAAKLLIVNARVGFTDDMAKQLASLLI